MDHDWFYAYKILVSVNIPVYIPRVGLATMVTHFDLPIVFYYFRMKKYNLFISKKHHLLRVV